MSIIELIANGCVFAANKQFEKAESFFHRAIQDADWDNQEVVDAHFYLSLVYLVQGNYKDGFREFEWRKEIDDPLNEYYRKTYKLLRTWYGQNLNGKRILVYAEQGVGDGLQFFRYLKHLKEGGAYVILHIHKPTGPLFFEHPWVDSVVMADVNEQFQPPPHDYHCSLMSLPYLLNNFSVSGEPYIHVKPKEIVFGPDMNVGIVWGGTQHHPNDKNRSIPLRHFKKLSAAKLWGLQVEPRPDLGDETFYTDLTPSIRNMVDTAHFLHNLDLLICCDTSIAHLAGAIGTPCWLLLPCMPDWRWGLDSEKTGWYNSLRLFRQSTPGDWEEVFERVSKALRDRIIMREMLNET